MKLKSQWVLVLTLITLIFCGCKSNTSVDAAAAGEVELNATTNEYSDTDKEKLLDTALKISGKKLSAQEQNVVMRMLNLSQEDMIRGLSVCAEFSDGRYPSSLDHETVIKQTEAWALAKYGKYDNLPIYQKKEIEKKMYDTFFMASYYKRLIKENKDAVYYGDTVTAEDMNAVLMRWKISDNEYRVIFGDLTTQNVTGKELAELEKLSLE